MKITEKKLANNNHQIYPLVPPFRFFCPVLAQTKVGSAGYHPIPDNFVESRSGFAFI